MVEKRDCSFCGSAIEPGTGLLYIKRDGTRYNFCSSKCRRNMLDLGRVPRTIKWSKHYIKGGAKSGKAPGKAMTPAPKAAPEAPAAASSSAPAEAPKAAKPKAAKPAKAAPKS